MSMEYKFRCNWCGKKYEICVDNGFCSKECVDEATAHHAITGE